jgi:hypothetical protein
MSTIGFQEFSLARVSGASTLLDMRETCPFLAPMRDLHEKIVFADSLKLTFLRI